MGTETISFLTPYLSGNEMMRIHLDSIRRFHSDAPILVSKKGGGADEMEQYKRECGIRYWFEDCSYEFALMRLLQRCETEYACILDHDTVLLSSIEPLLSGLAQGQYDLVGIEERIRVPDEIWKRLWPATGGWLRFAPGYMDATFLMFNLRAFDRRWGLGCLFAESEIPWGRSWEAHYGLCKKLRRHRYLRPYHAPKYGMGNLLMDGDTAVLWHQWYGSHSARLVGTEAGQHEPLHPADSVVRPVVEDAERRFVADCPNWDFSGLVPAWAPDCNILVERLAVALRDAAGFVGRLRRWRNYGLRGFTERALSRLNRWRHRGVR